MNPAEKIMFEIYRETNYNCRYQVVYFTELDEHNKEVEINRALAGEHFLDGFIKEGEKGEAKLIIQKLLIRLNNGEQVQPEEFRKQLADYLDD